MVSVGMSKASAALMSAYMLTIPTWNDVTVNPPDKLRETSASITLVPYLLNEIQVPS
jgi:hypothetical protein